MCRVSRLITVIHVTSRPPRYYKLARLYVRKIIKNYIFIKKNRIITTELLLYERIRISCCTRDLYGRPEYYTYALSSLLCVYNNENIFFWFGFKSIAATISIVDRPICCPTPVKFEQCVHQQRLVERNFRLLLVPFYVYNEPSGLVQLWNSLVVNPAAIVVGIRKPASVTTVRLLSVLPVAHLDIKLRGKNNSIAKTNTGVNIRGLRYNANCAISKRRSPSTARR